MAKFCQRTCRRQLKKRLSSWWCYTLIRSGVQTFARAWNCFTNWGFRMESWQYGGSICNGYRRLLRQNPCEDGGTYHTSLGISFDWPAITSGKKIVALDEVSVMVLTMVSMIDKWTTIASCPSQNRHGPILYWRQAFLGNSNKLMGPEPVTFSTEDLTNMVLCEDNNGHKEARTTWVPAGEGQNEGS